MQEETIRKTMEKQLKNNGKTWKNSQNSMEKHGKTMGKHEKQEEQSEKHGKNNEKQCNTHMGKNIRKNRNRKNRIRIEAGNRNINRGFIGFYY